MGAPLGRVADATAMQAFGAAAAALLLVVALARPLDAVALAPAAQSMKWTSLSRAQWVGRKGHCALVHRGYAFVIAGGSKDQVLNDVWSADEDGALRGSWATAEGLLTPVLLPRQTYRLAPSGGPGRAPPPSAPRARAGPASISSTVCTTWAASRRRAPRTWTRSTSPTMAVRRHSPRPVCASRSWHVLAAAERWTLTDAPGWSGRAELAATAVNGTMWIYGGTTGSSSYLNDIWRTRDGGAPRQACRTGQPPNSPLSAVHWTEVSPYPSALPRRAGAQAAAISGHLFLFGGRGTDAPDGSNTISYTRDGSAWPRPDARTPLATGLTSTLRNSSCCCCGSGVDHRAVGAAPAVG